MIQVRALAERLMIAVASGSAGRSWSSLARMSAFGGKADMRTSSVRHKIFPMLRLPEQPFLQPTSTARHAFCSSLLRGAPTATCGVRIALGKAPAAVSTSTFLPLGWESYI